MQANIIRCLSVIIFAVGISSLTGCVMTNAAHMTLGGNGQFKTTIEAWKNQIEVDKVQGGQGVFSGKSFQLALHQTLMNVGLGATDGNGTLRLNVYVTDMVAAPFNHEWAGVLKTRYVLTSVPDGKVLLNESIGTMCSSHPTHVRADQASVMEDCGRQNMASFLRKLETKGIQITRSKPDGGV